jgi:hypothetical protein
MPLQYSELFTEMIVECAASAAAISSIISTKLIASSPEPPYCSGTSTPMKPSSPALRMFSAGNSPDLSNSCALGAITSCANSRAADWIISWSSVSRKSMRRSGGRVGLPAGSGRLSIVRTFSQRDRHAATQKPGGSAHGRPAAPPCLPPGPVRTAARPVGPEAVTATVVHNPGRPEEACR